MVNFDQIQVGDEVGAEFVDGSTESFKVGKHIDLSKVSLDDSVRIQVTATIAIEFHKSAKK